MRCDRVWLRPRRVSFEQALDRTLRRADERRRGGCCGCGWCGALGALMTVLVICSVAVGAHASAHAGEGGGRVVTPPSRVVGAVLRAEAELEARGVRMVVAGRGDDGRLLRLFRAAGEESVAARRSRHAMLESAGAEA